GGLAGDDKFDNRTNTPSIQSGGFGNDILLGGSENDNLGGGSGTDRVTGGNGTDNCTAEFETTCEI
ncbi:MAG: hypothetical protein ACXWYP_09725, partial [Pseudonocardia sp.]